MRTKKPDYPYPYNFLSVVYAWSEKEVKEHTNANTLAGFYYVMSIMDDRSQDVINLYYRDNKTKKEVGDAIGRSSARVQQILSYVGRFFRRLSNSAIVFKGPMMYFEVRSGERANVAYREGYLNGYHDCSEHKQNAFEIPSIKEMNLSVRLYHCLTRDGIEDLKQLYETDPKHLMEIRCFGPKCLDELIEVLKLYNLDVQKYIDLKENNYE